MEAEGRYPLLVVILTLALLHLGGCRYPNDVADTTERVTAGTLRVGVAHNPPWVITDHEGTKEPAGIVQLKSYVSLRRSPIQVLT